MSWTLASRSTTIQYYRDLHERHRVERGLPPRKPKNNVRLHYFRKKISDFEIAHAHAEELDSRPQQPKICIIGAGMSGLFSALLLQKAGIKDITILECQKRVGGRVHTRYFPGKKEEKLYGELGAMRLPVTPEHQMVFDTIDYLNKKNNQSDEYRIDPIDFIFTDKPKNGLYYYNNVRVTQKYVDDPGNFHTLDFPTSVSPDYKKLLSDSMKYYFDLLDNDFDNGLRKLMEVDKYSVYSYLKEVYLPGKLDKGISIDQTIGAMEMTESATGLFRLSFVEAVMDAYTFSHNEQQWKTIDYGMQRFPDAFKPIVGRYIKYNCKVFELKEFDGIGTPKVKVYWEEDGNVKNEIFDKVIITCPLGVIRQWKLPGNAMDYLKIRAIRELNYDNSTKIFLKFKSRFWEKGPNPIIGGNSTTDLPIRTVIYPSYYAGMADGPAILLGSYTWANDAEKFAPYSNNTERLPPYLQENVRYCLRDLQVLHGEDIVKNAWDPDDKSNISVYWPNDPTTVGAFALFGPEQFEELLHPMIKPKLNIYWAGEHTDIHHAWIIGALNSAVRVVSEILPVKEWNELKSSEPLLNWHGHIKDSDDPSK